MQLALHACLRQTRLQPSHLPAGALLVIRRLDALPPFGPSAQAQRKWAAMLQARIDALAREALRPLHQTVTQTATAHAESVLFFDATEMLVCYTQDVLAQRSAWYWDELFLLSPNSTIAERLMAGWVETVPALPKALVQLRPAMATAALAALSPRRLVELTYRLHQTFALSQNNFIVESLAKAGTHAAEKRVPAPWQPWLGTASKTLTPAAAYLLGLSHMLVHQPQLARAQAFVHQAGQWLQAEPAPVEQRAVPAPNRDGLFDGIDRDLAAENSVGAMPAHLPRGQHEPASQSRNMVTSASDTAGVSNGAGAAGMSPVADKHAGAHVEVHVEAVPNARPDLPSYTTPQPASNEPVEPVPEDVATSLHSGLATQLGGAFYLVNLLSWLQWPGSVAELELLNPWALLGAMTADLLGPRLPHYQHDPLWRVLRRLANSDLDAQWGAPLVEPRRFMLQPHLFARMGVTELACRVATDGKRLRIWCMNYDFLAADVELGNRRADAIMAEYTAALDTAEVKMSWVDGGLPPSAPTTTPTIAAYVHPVLAWWLAQARPFVHFLLARRLKSGALLPETILTWPATLQITNTHVDIHLPLEASEVAIRRAGLDHSPGWLPEFGYIIAFYFD